MSANKNPKMIPVNERLIVALDVNDHDKAKALVLELGDQVQFYKLGLELFMAGNYLDMIAWLKEQGKKIFVDLKFFDVPNTVAHAVAQLAQSGVSFATVHGNDAILKAAVEKAGPVKILAVTALTSLDQGDLEDLGFECDVAQLVLSRARRAVALGCAGVISSGLEAQGLRAQGGTGFVIITPGIRPVSNQEDDQKRTVDVEEAFALGADYIVVGRPIRQAASPYAMAQNIQDRIAQHFEGV